MGSRVALSDTVDFQSIGRHPYPIALPQFATSVANEELDIVDIRSNGKTPDLSRLLREAISKPGHRSFPSQLLWNERRQQDSDEVISNTEISLVKRHSAGIAKPFLPGAVILELGSPSPHRTKSLLEAIEAQHKIVDYYALDLDQTSLERTLRELGPEGFAYVRCHGLLGTVDDARDWMSKYENKQRARCVLSLGEMVGSMQRDDAIEFWRKWTEVLRLGTSESLKHDDLVLVGIDSCKDEDTVVGAYDNNQERSKRFVLGVLHNANEQLGYRAFDGNDWAESREWDAENSRLVQYLVPSKDIEFEGVQIKAGERVFVVHDHKYDDAEKMRLWEESGLSEVQRNTSDDGSYGLHVAVPR